MKGFQFVLIVTTGLIVTSPLVSAADARPDLTGVWTSADGPEAGGQATA
jgi:hypothetical protein